MTRDLLSTRELLAELERRWRDWNLTLVDRLQPGLRDDRIDELVAPLGLEVSGEARVWWNWHDGVPASAVQYRRERAMTGSGLEPLPLEEAVEEAHQRRHLAQEIAGDEAERLWRASWLPFAENSGGTIAAFDCATSAGPRTPIHAVDWHRMGDNIREPQAASLGELVGWWLAAFDDGTYYYDAAKEMLLTDPDRLDAKLDLTRIV